MRTDIGGRFIKMKKLLLLCLIDLLGSCHANGAERIQRIGFESGGKQLIGLLALPPREAPHPVIVFVAGDGEFHKEAFFDASRTNAVSRAYRSVGDWHRFLDMGYACFAWDKPGAGESEGNWRDETVFDRAGHLSAALRFLRQRSDLDNKRIGLWGISQAGWVMPQVLATNPELAFMIAVSCPGQTIVEESGFLVERELLTKGVAGATAHRAREIYLRKWEMLRAGMPFGALTKYVRDENRILGDVSHEWLQPWKLEEYESLTSDGSTLDSFFYSPGEHLRQVRAPVLAVFGGKDSQVNAAVGSAAYREAFAKGENKRSTVQVFPEADHLLVRSETGSLTELRNRKTHRAVPEYWDAVRRFLRTSVAPEKRVAPGRVREFVVGEEKLRVRLNLHDEEVLAYEVNLTSLIRQAYRHFSDMMGGPPLRADGTSITELVLDVRQGRLSGEAHPGRLELTLGPQKVFGFLDWRALVIHELLHLWNAETFRYADYREQWFNEGATEYLTFKALMKFGLVAQEEGPLLLVRAWGNYSSARGIGEISLREAGRKDRKKGYYFLVYHGGLTACTALDYEIRSATGNKKSFEDLMRYLYVNHNHGNQKYNAVDLLKGLKAVSGVDFTDFFRRHIHGTEMIPIGRHVTRMEVEAIRLGQEEKLPEPDRSVLQGLFEKRR